MDIQAFFRSNAIGLYCCLVSFFLLDLPLSISGQDFPPKVSQYVSIEDHDGHPQIFCAEKLRSGSMAFGTAGRILIHNGEGLQNIFIGEGKEVHSMDKGPRGRLFVGGRSLMGVVTPDSSGDLKYHSLLPFLPDSLKDFGTVWNTWCSPDGEVYFNAQEKELFYYKDRNFSVIRPENSFYTMHSIEGTPVIQDRDTGLFRLKGDEKVFLPGSRSLASGKDIRSILPRHSSKKGEWTIFTRTSGAFHYDPGSGTVKRFMEGKEAGGSVFQDKLYSVVRMEPGKNPYGAAYAVGTILNGIHLLNPNGISVLHIDNEDGLPANAIWQVRRDERGNVWTTTNEGVGLIHTGSPFAIIEEGKGYQGDIMDITRPNRDPKKAPLLLATSQGVWEWQGVDNGSRIDGTEGNCNELLSVHSEWNVRGIKDGDLIIAGSNQGLLSARPIGGRSGDGWKARTLFDRHAYDISRIPASVHDLQKDLFVLSGRDGIFVLEPSQGKWKERASVRDIPERLTYSSWDSNGTESDSIRIWAAMSSKGLLAITADKAFQGLRTEHYDSISEFPTKGVQILGDPRNEGPLFGTKDGLYRYSGDEFRSFCGFSDLLCQKGRQVFRLEKGPANDLWVNDATGGKIKHVIGGAQRKRIDSLPFRFLDLGTIWAIYPEKGRTWFGGAKGAACYYPDLSDDPDSAWPCMIQEVRGANDSSLFGGTYSKKAAREKGGSIVGGRVPVQEQPPEMTPALPFSKGRVLFKFAAPFPDRQEKVRYRYRLAGFDSSWSSYTEKTEKEYTSLPEGDYCFSVKAKNHYGRESRTARYRFRILPPWYRTWWAYSFYSLSSVGFIAILLWMNARRLISQKQRLEKLVRERTQEIRQQKDRIESQKEEVEQKNHSLKEAHDQLKEAHKEITDSIEYARKIQNALLQSEEHVSEHLPEHFILLKPQSAVSGDFYWAREKEGYLYFAVVDCTGHGIPGAFMSMLGISQLNEMMAVEGAPSPGKVLSELRERVARELSSNDPKGNVKDGMDAALVKIPLAEDRDPDSSPGSQKVEFAGANNPLYVVKEGIGQDPKGLSDLSGLPEARLRAFKKTLDGIEIKGDKMAVGYEPDAAEAFRTVELEVPSGAMLYLFSDGYADQFGGPNGKKFRYEPFKELLARVHQSSPEEQKAELDHVFEEWRADQDQIDDVCVVGVRL